MFKVLDNMCQGMSFVSPLSKKDHRSSGIGYIDDITLGATATSQHEDNDKILENDEQEIIEVHRNISEMEQTWETMLHTNGGLLKLPKCYWILLAWRWTRGATSLIKVKELDAELRITKTEDNTTVVIPWTEVHDSPRVLGCHVAANGNCDREFRKWKSEAKMFAAKVKKHNFHGSVACDCMILCGCPGLDTYQHRYASQGSRRTL